MQQFAAYLFLVSEGIADRYTKAGSARSTEFDVIVHFIQMRLRPDKDSRSHIKPDSGAELTEKVIAAYEIRTPGERALTIALRARFFR